MLARIYTVSFLVLTLVSCAGSPPPTQPSGQISSGQQSTGSSAQSKTNYTLPDRTVFLQKDARWKDHRLGGSGEPISSDGCLVTAAAMTLANLGFKTDPGDLNARLKAANGYTRQGWLKWASLSDVTDGKAKARFYTEVSDEIIAGCMADGYYPLARFDLPNSRSHWAMILHRDARGYHMRDPLRPYKKPLIFPNDASGFKSVRCVGLAQ